MEVSSPHSPIATLLPTLAAPTQTAPAQSAPAQSASSNEMSRDRMEQVGQEFESVFLSMMLKEMRNSLGEDGFFSNDSSDSYGGLFDMFMAQEMARSRPLGIADMLIQQYEGNQAENETNDSIRLGVNA